MADKGRMPPNGEVPVNSGAKGRRTARHSHAPSCLRAPPPPGPQAVRPRPTSSSSPLDSAICSSKDVLDTRLPACLAAEISKSIYLDNRRRSKTCEGFDSETQSNASLRRP